MQIQGPWKTGIAAVAVSASPLSAQMVRWTRRLADSLDAYWMARTSSPQTAFGGGPERLAKNLSLARIGRGSDRTADEDLVGACCAWRGSITPADRRRQAGACGLWDIFRGLVYAGLVEESGTLTFTCPGGQVEVRSNRSFPQPPSWRGNNTC